ncbi:molybdopterin-dependent oxidoreductase [Herbidospora mongoliensis]|uniref:molybdopterin-dependent oxidoreductase n=1 Tax=Herbidospora mongoliensis TaxID=688067 RepID=UPI000833EEDF|nr:molybdopterin-dependent oxidoreductase [Herbidospora mongoliensis]
MTTVHRTCPLCEAVCGLTLTLDGTHVTKVTGDRDDPFSKGYICPKGASLGRLDEDPDRLSAPLVREGDQWREVSWPEAFAAVEKGLKAISGPERAIYLGNPSAHSMAGALYGGPLVRALGTRNVFSASTADQMPKHVASGLMFGHPMTIAVPDLDRTDFLLMLGANPLESNGSLCTAPDFPGRLKALQKRGGTFIVVDPRRTRTAELADEHVFIRPGTDAFLLAGIAHTLFAEDLVSIGLPVEGLAEVEAVVKDFPPHVVEAACGVPAEVSVRLARALAAAPSAAVYGRIGTCTAEFGTVTQWLVDVLNVLTGNLDRPGGAMFATPATEGPRRRKPYRTGRWASRVRGLKETNGELPVATLADEIETPGEGRIRALVTVAGNPASSAPNAAKLAKALERLDFMVSVDIYLNETTRHANVILPPPRLLATGHYDFALLNFAVRNYARYSPPIIDTPDIETPSAEASGAAVSATEGPGTERPASPTTGNRPSESEILARLAMIASGYGADADPAALDEMIIGQLVGDHDPAELDGDDEAEKRLDAMLRLGPYGKWNGGDLTLRKLRDEHPHGLDLGPLQSRLPEILTTASGKVELAPPEIIEDVERLRARLDEAHPEFVLIGRRHLRSNNSWLHNIGPLVGGTNRCTLQINPADVDRLGLGEHALIQSAAGELTVVLEPTDKIMPGVVSLPHGWGHDGVRQRVASGNAGVNVNVLTDEKIIDPLSGNAVFNGVPVILCRV